ncbi:MAG: YdiU family protein [Myxococcota bacterium]|nr:YdiU family protein [Myxococcota bacterium]
MEPSRPSALPLENTYARLPDPFHARVRPTPVAAPRLLRLNRPLAARLGLDGDLLASPEGVEILAGNAVPEGVEPVAMAYAGHQFGSFVPSLGDGRAVLLGEVVDAEGTRHDVHLKGSGRTPFSRNGDGRAALGPVLREYVVSEAMAALGIPTTRALAMVTTGEPVYRETALPGAILARVATSHVRVGTFEYFARRGHFDAVRALADYVIERLYPDAAEAANPYRALLDEVFVRQAELVAQWLLVGFIHGVMNTDNTSVSGETIDYGPCAFMDVYDPKTVYSSIDHLGRYAYDRQPGIAQWNLARFAETLLPLLGETPDEGLASAQEALGAYAPRFEDRWRAGLCRKIGLTQAQQEDLELAGSLLEHMAEQQADFTLIFRRLSEVAVDEPSTDREVRRLFADPEAFDAWAQRWRQRLRGEGRGDDERREDMRAANPAFVPRNHRVEQAIAAATAGDLAPFEELLAVVTRPYEDDPDRAALASPPQPHEVVHQTFCGT